jgi:flagellar M-ring protein FliF
VEFLRNLWEGLVSAWQRLSTSARVNMVVAALFTVAVIGVLVYFTSKPQYVELFTKLSPEDMISVQGSLEDAGVPFQTDSSGQNVLVPAQYRSDMRVRINAAGLVRSQGSLSGFELFNSANLMQNKFTQDVNYQRALMGELQRQLNEYAFVNKSYVMIREAKDELFASEQRPTEATVTLDVKQPLTEEQVKAVLGTITTFGGANLTRDHVNLVTLEGKVLNAPTEDDFDSVANSKLEYARKYRKDLEKSAEEALRDIGVQSVVRVALNIDHSRTTERSEEVKAGTPVSSLSSSSTTTSTQGAPEGPAGASANLPDDAPAPGIEQTSTSEEQTLDNFQPSRKTVEKVITPGTATATQVTAIVEGRYNNEVGPDGKETGKKVYEERTKKELDTYKRLVASAVGIEDTLVEVRDHPFDVERLAAATTAFEAVQTASFLANWQDTLSWILKLGAVAVAFLLVRRFLSRASIPMESEEGEVRFEMPTAGPEEMRKREIAGEVQRVSQEQPEAVAALLRTWLSERE